MNRMRLFISTILLASTALIAPNAAHAKGEDVVCAAVVPCSAETNWEVAAPYNAGACAATYEQVCQSQKSNELSLSLNACSSSTTNLQSQIKKLKAQVRKLKKARR